MLELSPGKWRALLLESTEMYEGALTGYEDVIRRYSYGMRQGQAQVEPDDEPDYQNRAFDFVAQMAARFSAGDPQAAVETSRMDQIVRVEARAHELALNRWSKQAGMRLLNEELAVDFSLWYAATIVLPGPGMASAKGHSIRGWPSAHRISPPRFFSDVQAQSRAGSRFRGDIVTVDRSDMLEAAKVKGSGWNAKVIKAMGSGSTTSRHETRRKDWKQVDRDEVTFARIWVPEVDVDSREAREAGVTLPEGVDAEECAGIWIYIPFGASSIATEEWLRTPRPYWGHPDGPYVVESGYIVPDQPVGMSPVGAVAHQIKALNKMWKAIHDSSLEYARLLLVSADKGSLANALAEGGHHHVIPVDLTDFTKSVATYEKGGLSDQMIVAANLWGQLVDQAMGMGDAQRSVASGAATATENIFAQQNWGTRVGHLTQKFQELNRGVFERMSWYFYHQDDVEVDVPELPGVYFGGGVEGMSWGDLDLTIDPQSMVRSSHDAEMAEGQMMLQIPAEFGPLMMQTPFVRWDEIVKTAAEKLNMPRLAEAFDWEMLRAVQGMLLQQGLQPSQPSQGRPEPRLSRDAGGGAAAAGWNFRPRTRPSVGAPHIGPAGGGGGGKGLTTGAQSGSVK